MISRRAMRWAVPVVVAIAVGGGLAISESMSASAAPTDLPARTPAQLVTALESAQVTPMSGTVVQNAKLGLPSLPSGLGGQGSSDLSSMLAGAHTLRVWTGGPDKVRLALLGTLGESDVVYSGSNAWIWSSNHNSATHYLLPSGKRPEPVTPAMTPQQATAKLLASISPTTTVTVGSPVSVAGRAAYDLVIAPRQAGSLIGSIHIAIDARTHVPLRVQLYATGATAPAFAVGYTQVSFGPQSAREFQFTPPPGAKVTTKTVGAPDVRRSHPQAPDVTTVGTGWSTVLVLHGARPHQEGRGGGQLSTVLRDLPAVSGSWGSGHLLSSAVFTALLTDDGRVLIGAVPPRTLYAAASR